METINDRMEMIINERFNGNKAAFAKSIGMSPATMSSYLGKQRRSKPSVDMVAKIVLRLGVDARWLLTGEEAGQGRSSLDSLEVSGKIVSKVSNRCPISAVNGTVGSGAVFDAADDGTKVIIPRSVAELPDTDVYELVKNGEIGNAERLNSFDRFSRFDMYYRVKDDAMMPLFMRDDILALANFPEEMVFPNGSPMVVGTRSCGFVFRHVHDMGDALECRVANAASGYADTAIPKSQVIRLYRVVGMIRIGV